MSALFWICLKVVAGVAWADGRIDAHLARVEASLRASTQAAPTSDLAIARERNLDALHAYRVTGRYPHNSGGAHAPGRPPPGGYDERPGENPVFIDEAGVPCAVGWLLIASGHADIAEAIRVTDNRSRLADIHLPALDAWIASSGLSALELAQIQPSYEPRPWPAYEGTCDPREVAWSLYRENSGGGSIVGHPWHRAVRQANTMMPEAYRACLVRRIVGATDAHSEREAASLLMSLELSHAPPAGGRVAAGWESPWRALLTKGGDAWQKEESAYIQYLYDGERFADLIARVDERVPAMRGGGPVVLQLQLARILAVTELVRRQAELAWTPRLEVSAGVVGVINADQSIDKDVAKEFRGVLSALVVGDAARQRSCAPWNDPLPADHGRSEHDSIDLRVEGRVVAAVTGTEGAMLPFVECLVTGIVGRPMTAVRDDTYRMSVNMRQLPEWSYRSYPLDPS